MDAILNALKYLPENINAAKTSPLGIVAFLIALAFLLALAFFIRERWQVKAGVLAGFLIFGLFGLMIGDRQRVAQGATPKQGEDDMTITVTPKPSGRVVDENNKAVADARVFLEPGGIPHAVVTDGDGRYMFDGFKRSVSRPTLIVTHPEFADRSMNLPDESIGARLTIQLKRLPNSKPGPPSSAGRTVTLTGEVIDPKGSGVARAEVTVQVEGAAPLTALTNSDGTYTILKFRPPSSGVVKITVRKKGFETYTRDIQSSDVRPQQIQLAPDPTASRHVLSHDRASAAV